MPPPLQHDRIQFGRRGRGRIFRTSRTTSRATTPLLLDTVTSDVYAAWSVTDQLKAAYVGELFTVERDSDNDQLAIYADASGRMDQAALLDFAGAATASVMSVANQGTADAFTLSAPSEANQPIIVNAGVLVVRGANDCPAMAFNGLNDFPGGGGPGTGSFLRRDDALGLTGNPGICAHFDYQHNDASAARSNDDRFPWSIGDTAGQQCCSMTSRPGGAGDWRMSSSTLAVNRNYTHANMNTWGRFRHNWPVASDVSTTRVYRNDALGTFVSDTGPGSPNMINSRTCWGTSTFSNGAFSAYGWMANLFLLAQELAPDSALIDAWFALR